MNADLYEQFIDLKDLGKKAEAKAALDLFIASFQTPEEIHAWVLQFMEKENLEYKIRHELYEKFIYPVLLDGYLKNDVKSIFWLAKTAQNLYAIKSPHPKLRDKGDFALFREAYELEQNAETAAGLFHAQINWFSFSRHEWPVGILFGMNGANLQQCEEILQEIQFARSIEHPDEWNDYLSDFEAKVHEYIRRLKERA